MPCNRNTPKLENDVAEALLTQLNGWRLEAGRLTKSFRFKDYLGAIEFVNALTPLAEAAAHHPDLEVGWGRVRIELITDVIGALSEIDFVLAARIDRLPYSP